MAFNFKDAAKQNTGSQKTGSSSATSGKSAANGRTGSGRKITKNSFLEDYLANTIQKSTFDKGKVDRAQQSLIDKTNAIIQNASQGIKGLTPQQRWMFDLKDAVDYSNSGASNYEKTTNLVTGAKKNLLEIQQAGMAEGLSSEEKKWYRSMETSYSGVIDYLTKRGYRENTYEYGQNKKSLEEASGVLGQLQQQYNDLQSQIETDAAAAGTEALRTGIAPNRQQDSRTADLEKLGRQIEQQQTVVDTLQQKIAAYQPNTNEEREELVKKLQDPHGYDKEMEELGYSKDFSWKSLIPGGSKARIEEYNKKYKELRDRDRARLKEIDEGLYNESQDYTAGDRADDWLQGVGENIGSGIANAAGTTLIALDEDAQYRQREQGGGFLVDRSEVPGLQESNEERKEAAREKYPEKKKPTVEDFLAPGDMNANIPEPTGMSKLGQQLQNTADRLGESAQEDLRMAKTGAGKGAQIAMDIGQTVIEMGFDAAVGGVTGTGMLPMFTRVFGQEAQQVRLNGGDLNAQLGSGLTRATIEVATEKLFDGVAGIFGKGAADDVVEDLIRDLSGSRLGQNMLRAIAGATGEGTEEALADLFGVLSDKVWKDKTWKEAWDENMETVLYDFLMGAAVGGLGGAAGIVGDYTGTGIGGYAEKNAEIQFNRDLEAAGADPQLFRKAVERELSGEQGPLTKKDSGMMSAWQAGQRMLQERRAKAAEEFQKQAIEAIKKRSTLSGSVDLTNVQVGFGGKAVYMSGFIRENGRTMVELKTGTGEDATVFTVDPSKVEWYDKSADESRLTPEQQQRRLAGRFLEELSRQEHPEVMAMLYNPGQDIGEFINQWNVAERVYGRLAENVTADSVLQQKELGSLTPQQISAAYEIGRAELEQAKARTAVPEGVDIKSLKPGAGKVSYNGATIDGATYDAVALDTLSEKKQAQINALKAMAEVTGVNIVFYQSQVNAQGYYQGANGLYKNGCIYLDVNAGLNQRLEDGRTVGEVAIVRTAAHELTHFIQDFNAAQYEKIRSFIIGTLLQEKGMDSLEDLIAEKQLRDRTGKLTRDEAIDEIIADGCEMMLRDTKTVERLAAEQPGIANRIKRWISQWVKKIQAAFEGVDATHTEARILMEHAEELQRIWDEAFENAARIAGSEYGKSDGRARYEEAAQEGGQYSLRDKQIPTREELEQKPDIPVTDIRAAQTGTIQEERQRARESKEAEELMTAPEKNIDTGEQLFFAPATLSHTFSNKGRDNIRLVRKYREIVRNAVLTHGEPSRKAPDDHTTGVYKFFGAALTDQGIQPVKLTVKEYYLEGQDIPPNIREYAKDLKQGDIYASVYDGKVLIVEEIEEETSSSAASSTQAKPAPDEHPSVSTSISIRDLLNLVKGEDQKYIPQPETKKSEREYTGKWKQYNGVEEEAKRHFGTTTDIRTAGYVLPDGTMLDFSGAHWLEGYDAAYIADWRRKNDIRQVDHEDVYEAFDGISDNPPNDSAMVFIERGNIRMSPEAPGIELSAGREPTAEQYAIIRKMVRETSEARSFYVDLMKDGRHGKEKLTYEGGVNADRVVNDIKHYYQTGEVRQQSEVSKFRYSVREEWISELDKWLDDTKDHKDLRPTAPGYFHIGEVSEVLKNIGVKNTSTYWRKYKIGEILEEHPELDEEILKQVPDMMENPVFVMRSITRPHDSLTMIGDLKAKDGNTVMAALELTPKPGGGMDAEFALLTSAHRRGKTGIAHLLNESEILYFDQDAVKAGTWSMQLRVQFPSRRPSSGYVGSVTYEGKTVKISGKKLEVIGGEVIDQDTGKVMHSEREYGPDERDLVREYAARPGVNDEFLGKWLDKVQRSEALRMKIRDYDRSIQNLEERIRKAEAGELKLADPARDRETLQRIRDSRAKVTEKLNRLEKMIAGMERRQEYKSAVERTREEWSTDPKETARLIRELREMNRQLEEQLDYWKQEGRLTDPKERKARRTDVERFARQLAKNYGYRGNIADLIGMMQDAADMVYAEDLSSEELQERARSIAQEIMMNAVQEFDPEQSLREELRSRLRDLRIRPDENWTGDFGDWNDFRNRNFNKLFFSKEGENIDDVYQQLNGEFGDGLFPPDITAGSDQVYQILAALDKLQPVETSMFRGSDEMAMVTAALQNEITNTLLFGNIGEELTQADRDYRSLGERLQKAREEAKSAKKTVAELQRAQHLEIQGALMAQRQQYRDREKRTKARARIQKTGLRLLKYLTENNGQKNPIPEPMKEAVGSLLMDLDLSGGLDQKRKNRYVRDMQAVQKIVMQQQAYMAGQSDAWGGMMLDLPADTIDQLNEHLERIQNAQERAEEAGRVWNPYMMKIEELQQLDEILTVFTNAITKSNEILSNARGEKISEAAAAGVRYLNSLKPDTKKRTEKGEALNKFLRWQNTTPYYYFRKFGEPGLKMFENIQDGWDKFAFNAQQIIEFAESAYTAEEAKKIQDEVLTFKLRRRGDLSEGMEKNEEVTMTKAQVMSLYCLMKRAQARGHIEGAGIRIADYKQGTRKVTQAENYLLDITDAAKIIDSLTEREKEIADKLQNYMNTVGSEWGNEVSLKRFGIRSFTEENYFPITTDDRTRQVRNPESDTANLYRLLNMSFTKATVRDASNAIVLDNIFDVFSNHMADMAKYNGLGLPMLDAMKWMSYTVLDEKDPESGQYGYESMQKAAERAYGREARNYFVTFLKDLNGVREGGRGEEFGSKILSNYKVAAVGANLRVAVLQPTSYVRAAAVIDRKWLAQGLKMSNSQGRAEAEKYSGTAVWKALGFYDTNINAGLREMIKHTDTKLQQIQEVSMKGAELGDKVTWGALWNACKAEQQAEAGGKISNEELMERTSRRFREVVYRTQVMDSTMTRSHVMRQKGVYAGMVTAFMSEPTVSFNMLLDAYGDYETKLRQGMNKSAAWQASKGAITKAFGAYVATAVLSAVVESIVDAARDDDEYATYVQRWLEKFWGVNLKKKDLTFGETIKGFFGGNLMDDLLVHNKLPIIKDFFATLAGSSSGRMDTEWMNNVVKALNIWRETIALAAGWQEEPTKATYSGNMTTWGKLYATLRAASQVSGLPIGNAMRDAVALWNSSVGEFAPGMKIQTYNPGKEKSIKYALQDGYMTEDEAVKWLLKYELAKDETEARQKVFIWANPDRYAKLIDAMNAGDDDAFADAYEELTALKFKPSSMATAVKNEIEERYVGREGEARLGKEEAVEMLVRYAGLPKRKAEQAVEQWTAEVVTGIKFTDIDDAYMAGDITKDRAQEMLVTYGGYTERDAAEKVTEWTAEKDTGIKYSELSETYVTGEITREQTQDMLVKYGGYSAEDAAAKVQQWTAEKDTGIKYTEIKDVFLGGEISEQQVVDMLVKYGGKSQEDAVASGRKMAFQKDFGYEMERINIQEDYADGGYTHDQMKQILLEYGYSKNADSAESTVTRWDFVGQDWSLDGISGFEAQRYYNYNVGAAGITKHEWMDWLEIAKKADDAGKLKGTVKGYSRKGAAIYVPYSKQDKIMALIDSFPLSPKEKDALYLAGWDSGSEGNSKNLWRAPWHKKK